MLMLCAEKFNLNVTNFKLDTLWNELNGKNCITSLSMKLYRMVENQEEVATTLITSNSEEQSILEDLLEQTKPVQTSELEKRHYLIKTPFRYPPLNYGSRFGSILEPSLFYGATDKQTVLAEVAYYRFRFLADVEDSQALTKFNLQSNHSIFYVNTHSERAVQLTQSPFKEFKQQISAPDSFATSQKLSRLMREDGIELFSYYSARNSIGINGAAFTHKAIKSKTPKDLESWLCLTQNKRIVFHQIETRQMKEFTFDEFCVDGKLPVIY